MYTKIFLVTELRIRLVFWPKISPFDPWNKFKTKPKIQAHFLTQNTTKFKKKKKKKKRSKNRLLDSLKTMTLGEDFPHPTPSPPSKYSHKHGLPYLPLTSPHSNVSMLQFWPIKRALEARPPFANFLTLLLLFSIFLFTYTCTS